MISINSSRLQGLLMLGSYTRKAFFPWAIPRWMLGIEQSSSLWERLQWIWRVALQPKVHIINTVGLLPIYLSWREIPSGNKACRETFLINTACWIAYGHAVQPTLDSMLFSIAMVMVTRV